MTYRILLMAREDVDEAQRRLNREHTGYGESLLELVAEAIEAVMVLPEGYSLAFDAPRLRRNIREVYIKRFKYSLLYLVYPTEIVFFGLIHARRKPGSWTNRLKELR
jgi:hypothetical protein